MHSIIRSPFFYVGDKYKIISQIKQYFPSNIDTYIEPFCGGGSSFLNVNAKKYLLNDIDFYIIELHKLFNQYKNSHNKLFCVFETIINVYQLSCSYKGITVPEELKKKYIKTYYAVYNKNSFLKMRNDFNKNKSNLNLLYLLLIYGFNHFLRFNKNGDFNLPVGNVDFNSNVANSIFNYLTFSQSNNITFYNNDFETFINSISPNRNDFIYFDLPYLISNSEYNKLWREKEEERLLKLLDELDKNNIKFALSNVLKHKNNQNTILINWAKKYNVFPISSNYISYHDNTIKKNTGGFNYQLRCIIILSHCYLQQP